MNKLNREARLFMLPGILGLFVFFILPFIGGVYYAVHSDIYPPQFVGIATFHSILQNDIFRSALWNTIKFSLICAPLAITISLIFACYLRNNIRGRNWMRATMIAPYVLPTAAVVSIWKIIFGYNSINAHILNRALGMHVDLLQGKVQIIPIILLYIWRNTGFFTVILISAMQVISNELYEYAELEGASAIQKHSCITIPLIAPSFLVIFLFSWTGSLKVFKEVYALSNGYPPSNLYTLQHFINNHLSKLNYSIVTSAAYVFTLFLMLIFSLLFYIEKHFCESIGG